MASFISFISCPPSRGSFCKWQTSGKQRCATRAPGMLPSRCRTSVSKRSWHMGATASEFSKDLKPAVTDLMSRLKKCSVYFVGPMGSGKSAVAKYLAHQFRFRFLDTDELIELTAKKDIPTIFEEDGEEAFRDFESAILDQVQAFIGCCVATGGGIVMRQKNWGKLQTGIVVWLDVPVDVLVGRLQGDTTRPLLQGDGNLRDKIETIANKRRPMYAQADIVVQISADDAVDHVGEEVVRKLNSFIKENPPRLAKLYAANLAQNK